MTPKTHAEVYQEYEEKKGKILAQGGEKGVEKQHKDGKMTARERIDYFFDEGTFTEIGMFVKHRTTAFGLDKKEIPAEGVITGFGKVNGRSVVVAAEDYTTMAGTYGEGHGKKFARAVDFAKEKGCPFVGMNDSGGARLQEGMDTLEAYGWLFNAQIRASGIIPQIALLMGPCLGGQAYHPIMQDFLIQCKDTGFMGIAGPAFVKTQIGEEITLDQLSGWRAHAVKSGQSHMLADDDKDCMDKAKALLDLLPSNNQQKPPIKETSDDPNREIPELNEIVPVEQFRPFNMMDVISRIVDDGSFMETLALHATNLITGFARFNGRTTGIVANQPMQKAGMLDIDASDKLARFVRTCDLFNVPVVTLVDCPCFIIGSDADWRGILRHGAKTLYAWSDATVPLISIILRKSYAGAHYGMLDKSIGADLVWAWPQSQITIVGAATASSVIFAKEIKNSENPQETAAKRMQEYSDLYENPYVSSERGYTDGIIMPAETRKYINMSLDSLENKQESRPWRKYSNINL
ncbi:MAG: acyl-CoA carboxylase subunit beta [Chloroflexi bacterium]|jgi:methylmalonyl-CoA decarboxylase subunit alpha|nr:acyl-CoA carboxylase subunit beta [Chloroflexota bacterium]